MCPSVCAAFACQKRTEWFDVGRKDGEQPPLFICTMNVKQLTIIGKGLKVARPLVEQWQATLSAPVQL